MIEGQLLFLSQEGEQEMVVDSARKTESLVDRTKGLLGAPELNHDEALWITPCNSIHTFGMNYYLDIVYVDRFRTVKKMVPQLSPRRASFCFGAKSVIELRAGTIATAGIKLGQRIEWIEK